MKTPSATRLVAGASLVAAGIVIGLLVSAHLDPGSTSLGTAPALAGPESSDVRSSAGTFTSPFVSVAEKVVPAVVAISTSTEVEDSGMGRFRHPWEELFDFEDLFPNNPRRRDEDQQRPRRNQGAGSGFLLDPAGHIMTNNHVVRQADEVTVRLADGTELEAKVIGQDPETDVAVVKIEPHEFEGKLPSLEMGDSDQIRVGDWAVAVGNPFGQLQGSLTVGVISATGRSDLNIMGGTPTYQSFIQTDASINFGNSGGPLVDIHGRVIGMNTAINPMGQGIGFAIPINMALKVADELIEKGRVVRGYLGIRPQALTPDIAAGFDLEDVEGVLIAEVVPDTPAADGGLETGDVITKLNGEDVADVNDFRMRVAEQGVGESIKLEVLRDGKKKSFEIVLAERPTSFTPAGAAQEDEDTWAGLSVEELDAERARRLFDDSEVEGILVVDVEPGSAADDAGIRPGDVIKEIGNVEVTDRGDYGAAVEKYRDKKAVAILLRRGNQTLYVGLKP
jgi:serine protease Do